MSVHPARYGNAVNARQAWWGLPLLDAHVDKKKTNFQHQDNTEVRAQ